MPELPEVETIKEAMRKSLQGARIESVEIYNRSLRQPIVENFEKIVCSAKIVRLYRIAKYALMELDNGYSLIWHFGMSGRIKITDKTPLSLEKHDHVVLITSKGNLIYNDTRRFGLIALCKTSELKENPLLKPLGLDPFDKDLTPSYLAQAFKNKNVLIKIALLDQHIISGIGNIYASEALYEARISPLCPSSLLSMKELEKLIEAIRIILKKAIDAGGSTLHDYKQPDGHTGYFQFQHSVYGKDGQHCPHCTCHKDGILKLTLGGRSTYYCPHLQKLRRTK